MKKLLLLLLFPIMLFAQNPVASVPPFGAYVWDSGTGNFDALTGTSTGTISQPSVPGYGVWYFNTSTNLWYPCTLNACFGGASGGPYVPLAGNVSLGSATGSSGPGTLNFQSAPLVNGVPVSVSGGTIDSPDINNVLHPIQGCATVSTDVGTCINAAIQASSLTIPSEIEIDPATTTNYPLTTPIVIDRPVKLVQRNSKLIYQSGGASGVWGSSPITLSGSTLTLVAAIQGGSNPITVSSCAGLTPSSNQQIAVSGVGLPPDDYVQSCSGTSLTVVQLPMLWVTGIPVSGSPTLCGVANLSGLAVGQNLTGTGFAAVNISAINQATNCLTMASNATSGAANGPNQKYQVAGSLTTTLTAQKVTPAVQVIYNSSALHNEFGQMVGSSIDGLWIQDPAGVAGNSVTGVQGVQINGWDRFVMTDYECDGMPGSCLILSGYTGVNAGLPTRESNFDRLRVRNSGNWLTGQSAVLVGNQDTCSQDEINQIGFESSQIVYSDGTGLDVTTYVPITSCLDIPRLIWFNGANGQIEAGSARPGTPNMASPGPGVNLQWVDDIYFDNVELNGEGYGTAIINTLDAYAVTADHSRLCDGCSGHPSFSVTLTNGSPTVTLNSGISFDTSGRWNGVAVSLVDGTTCTTGSPCVTWLSTNAVTNTTTLSLASNYAGTSTGSGTMTIGATGTYLSQHDIHNYFEAIGNEYTDPTAFTLAALGYTSISGTNVLLTGNTGENTPYLAIYNGANYSNLSVSGAPGINGLLLSAFGTNNSNIGGNLPSSATGSNNTAGGSQALNAATTANDDTAYGRRTLFSCTTCSNSTATGFTALGALSTGSNDTADGYYSLQSLTTGTNDTAQGLQSMFNMLTGSGNTADGVNAGNFISGGATANQTSANSVYLGYGTMALADGDTNETVIGYNATGNGSNTTTVGNSSTTDVYLGSSSSVVHGGSFTGAGSLTAANSWSGLNTFSNSPTGSAAGTLFNGTPTTSSLYFPVVAIDTAGAAAPTRSANGTMFEVNAPSGFTGNLATWYVNGVQQFALTNTGQAFAPTGYTAGGNSTGSVLTTSGLRVANNLFIGFGTSGVETTSMCYGGAAGVFSFESAASCTNTVAGATGTVAAAAYNTGTNCSSSASPAVCGAAAAGSVALPTNAVSSSIVVNTTAVTANSQILVTTDDTLGTKLGVTCNSTVATLVGGLTISARTAGTSFTIANNVAVVTNPLCVSYLIIN
jgi:hypothetical protein